MKKPTAVTEQRASAAIVAGPPELRALRRLNQATVDAILEDYVERRLSAPTISAARGLPRSTVYYHLHRAGVAVRPPSLPSKHLPAEPRVCANESCDVVFTPPAHNVAHGFGRFCSRGCAREASRTNPLPGERHCKQCGAQLGNLRADGSIRFSPADVQRGRGQFCTWSCRQTYWFFHVPERVQALCASLERDGAWTAPAKRRWAGRRTLKRVRAPQKKGEAAARETGERAIAIVRGLNGKWSPELRRSVIERLMREEEGDSTVLRDDSERRDRKADPTYRNARARVMQRLKRADRDLDGPEELARLI